MAHDPSMSETVPFSSVSIWSALSGQINSLLILISFHKSNIWTGCLSICSSIRMDPGQMAVWFYYFPVPCHTGANTERLGCGVQFWRRCQLKVELSLICFSLSGSRHAQPCPVLLTLFPPIRNYICMEMAHGMRGGGGTLFCCFFRWGKKGLCI